MRYDFRCSEDEDCLFEVISDTFLSIEVILLKLGALISSIVFPNDGPGSIFADSILSFILSRSKFSSEGAVIL